MAGVTLKPTTPLSLPWKTRLLLSLLTVVTKAAYRSDGTINRCLLGFFAGSAPPNSKPVKGVKTADVTVDPSKHLWYRIFIPAQSTTDDRPLPVIVFFHGGGFVHMSADDFVFAADSLVQIVV